MGRFTMRRLSDFAAYSELLRLHYAFKPPAFSLLHSRRPARTGSNSLSSQYAPAFRKPRRFCHLLGDQHCNPVYRMVNGLIYAVDTAVRKDRTRYFDDRTLHDNRLSGLRLRHGLAACSSGYLHLSALVRSAEKPARLSRLAECNTALTIPRAMQSHSHPGTDFVANAMRYRANVMMFLHLLLELACGNTGPIVPWHCFS